MKADRSISYDVNKTDDLDDKKEFVKMKNNHMFISKTARFNDIQVKKQNSITEKGIHLVKEEYLRNSKIEEKFEQEAEQKRTRDFKQRIYKSNLSFETASL